MTMPFTQYGILSGTLLRHRRDDPDDFGRWWHVQLFVSVNGTERRIAVDVDSKASAVGVQWKDLHLTTADFRLPALPAPGFAPLVSAPGTGALDVIRHRALRILTIGRLLLWPLRVGGAVPAARRWNWIIRFRPWRSGDHLQASEALEAVLTLGAPVMIWGEPFPEGAGPAAVQGMHNVHQNQGDPAGSQWWAENGVWQDGAVACRQPDGRWRVFVSKFSTQADRTDAGGHPA